MDARSTATTTWQSKLRNVPPGKHIVQYYTDKIFLANTVSFFAAEGFKNNEKVFLILSPSVTFLFRNAIEQTCGISCARLENEGKLQILDGEKLLNEIMPHGKIDHEHMKAVLKRYFHSVPNVRVYGEMVNILWQRGKKDEAIELDACWNETIEGRRLPLFCAYEINASRPETYDEKFANICECHNEIISCEDEEKFHQMIDAGLKKIGVSFPTIFATLAMMENERVIDKPDAQKCLLWLFQHIPHTAKKVLQPN